MCQLWKIVVCIREINSVPALEEVVCIGDIGSVPA